MSLFKVHVCTYIKIVLWFPKHIIVKSMLFHCEHRHFSSLFLSLCLCLTCFLFSLIMTSLSGSCMSVDVDVHLRAGWVLTVV